MQVNVTTDKVSILSIVGKVDSSTFQQLIDKASPLLMQGYKNWIVDLSQVDFVSSGGLVAFQTIAGKAAGMNGKVVFAGLSKNVAKVFELTGFSTMLRVFPDLASAQASFEQG